MGAQDIFVERVSSSIDSGKLKTVCDAFSSSKAREEALTRLTRLATRVLQVPVGVVSLIDQEEEHFKCLYSSGRTYPFPASLPLEESLCHFILDGEILAIEKLEEFKGNFNRGLYERYEIASYLGAPLRSENGVVVGTLCVLDTRARTWSDQDLETLGDIADCVMTELQLQVSMERINHENDCRERIISMLAHDLRTPLNIIQNNAEMVLLEESDTSLMKDCTLSILRHSHQATQLIDNFLDWKLSSLGPSDNINKEAFDIVELAKVCVFELAKIHGDIFRLTYNQRPLTCELNEFAMRRCLENLIGNALKYGDVSREISIHLEQGAETLELSVHNFGGHLSDNDLKSIFNPYYRSVKTQKARGWGLGLALVHAVALAHDGTVSVQSAEGAGTIFKMVLPLRPKRPSEALH